MADTAARLTQCFSAVFPELSEKEIPLASATSVGTWDSLASVTLTSVIEEEFKIQVNPEDLEQLVSYPLILAYLQNGKNGN